MGERVGARMRVRIRARKSGVRDKKLRAPLTTDKVGGVPVDENTRSIPARRELVFIYATVFTIIARFAQIKRGTRRSS